MKKIWDEQVADGKDNAEVYAAILDKMKQKSSAGYAKDEALYEDKNKYNDVKNTHFGWVTSHGVCGDARSRYMDALFDFDLDNASAQEIWSRIDRVQRLADTAPDQADPDDYVNWAAQAVAELD